MKLGLDKKQVELTEYSKRWKNDFVIESRVLKEILHDFDIVIEHIGSTAIPNMEAKPIIDILIGIKSIELLKNVRRILDEHNYIESEISLGSDELLFGKLEKEGGSNRTHYIHVVEYNGKKWNNYILFRDYLIANPEEAIRYLELKRRLSLTYSNNRKRYTGKKGEFVKELLKKATNHDEEHITHGST